MRGECRGNVRSTPTPWEIRRTAKVSRTPPPRRLMTTPSNAWTRSRPPSDTLRCTRSVTVTFSISRIPLAVTPHYTTRADQWNSRMSSPRSPSPSLPPVLAGPELLQDPPVLLVQHRPVQQVRPPQEGPPQRLALPPPADLLMVAA